MKHLSIMSAIRWVLVYSTVAAVMFLSSCEKEELFSEDDLNTVQGIGNKGTTGTIGGDDSNDDSSNDSNDDSNDDSSNDSNDDSNDDSSNDSNDDSTDDSTDDNDDDHDDDDGNP